jgi:hypothetical protein
LLTALETDCAITAWLRKCSNFRSTIPTSASGRSDAGSNTQAIGADRGEHIASGGDRSVGDGGHGCSCPSVETGRAMLVE